MTPAELVGYVVQSFAIGVALQLMFEIGKERTR